MEEARELAAVNSIQKLAVIIEAIQQSSIPPESDCNLAFLYGAEALMESVDFGGDEDFFSNFRAVENTMAAIFSCLEDADVMIVSAQNLDANEKDLVRGYVARVRTFMYRCQFGDQWINIRGNYLSDDLISGLKMSATLFKISGHNINLSAAELTNSRQKIDELIASVKESDLPKDLLGEILGSLLRIQYILRTYELFGAQDMDVRLKAIVGEIVVSSSELSDKQKEEVSPVLGWVGTMLTKYERFGKLAKTTESLVKMFLGFGAG